MTAALWDKLNADPRHQLKYPSEHVVRWLSGLAISEGKALDIGCGSGRHLSLLVDMGFTPVGVDASMELAGKTIGIYYSDMAELPFHDDLFDVALAFGVFYYGTISDHRQAVREMHRVLKPGGHGLAVIRSPRDGRAAGPDVSSTRRMLEGDEAGMLINFLSLAEIGTIYGMFSEVTIDTTETSRDQGRWLDSDWLIRVVK